VSDTPTPNPKRTSPSVSFTASGKPKRSIESLRVERQYRNVIRLFLAGELPNFSHHRHVQVANILRHIPYGRELMHLGLQVMAYRNFVPDKYSAEITDYWWDRLDGTLPDPTEFADLPGGADGVSELSCREASEPTAPSS
jgi:hypothetical protein